MSLSPEQVEQVIALAADLAREGKAKELREFVDHGLPVDTVNSDGDSLLMLAAYHGHLETVAMLLDAGADPDLRNNRDQSPIAGAIFKGEDAVVEKLKSAGANIDAGTPSARQAAEMFGRQHLLAE